MPDQRPRWLFLGTGRLVYVGALLGMWIVQAVIQALALTGVAVEAAVTALLSFAIQAHKRFGTLDPHELAEFKS